MRILFVIASCLKVNTSANLCHIAYIQGCIDNGFDVDVISMDESGCNIDGSIVLPKGCRYYNYVLPKYNNLSAGQSGQTSQTKKSKIKGLIKAFILKFYGVYGRTYTIWMKKALKFKNITHYDLVISLATPYSSHHLAHKLIQKRRIKYSRWIQIWEDPWATDLYNIDKSNKKYKEEKNLLSYADSVLYVSPLTLENQKKLFPEFANKMNWHPLPYYYKLNDTSSVKNSKKEIVFGYYGDYHSFSRNLLPFYEAAKTTNIKANIWGNSDTKLESTNNILVKPRVPLDELNDAEIETDVYVFLCNLGGGQIPGKIYPNSATKKYILFILDGSCYEKEVIKNFFSKYNRYIFCDNTVESISDGIKKIQNDEQSLFAPYIVEAFSPKNTIVEVLEKFNIYYQ